jgi:hypothetical protein
MNESNSELGELRISAALAFCKLRGLAVSDSGLRAAGLRDGFSHAMVIQGHRHWVFNVDGLSRFVEKSLAKPPAGFFTVRAAAARLGLTRQGVYWRVRAGWMDSRVIGPGHGVLYVR